MEGMRRYRRSKRGGRERGAREEAGTCVLVRVGDLEVLRMSKGVRVRKDDLEILCGGHEVRVGWRG